jgi:hypothetical protein
LLDRRIYARPNLRNPDPERKFLAAATQRQLERRLKPSVEVLVKPVCRRAKYAAGRPVDSDDAIAETVFKRSRAPFIRSHERIAFRAEHH